MEDLPKHIKATTWILTHRMWLNWLSFWILKMQSISGIQLAAERLCVMWHNMEKDVCQKSF
ncbi:hypothetical protein D3C81_2202340 [compost metagenome]